GWGRLAAADEQYVAALLKGSSGKPPREPETLDSMIERRAGFLQEYQDKALGERYLDFVNRARAREASLRKGHDLPFTTAVAKSWFKTLAYKDEYEVARLHVESGFLESVKREFGDEAKITFHLAPPILNKRVDARGRPC